MSIQISRLVKDTVTYSLGALLNRMLMFLLLPLFTRLLTPNDYGVNAVIGTLLVGLSGFFGLGTGTSLGVLYFELREESARSTVIWTSVIFLTAHSLVLCGVAAVFATPLSQMFFQSPEYSDLIRMGLVTTGLLTASEPFFAFLRMEKKARLVVALSVVETVLGLALSVYLVAVMHRGLRGIFESALLVKGLMFVIALAVIGRRLPIRLDLKLVARLVRIGFPSVLGTGAFFVVDYLDRVMLQQMTSTGTVGVYSVGYNFGMVMLLAVSGFGSAWPPYFLSFIDRREEAQAIFGRVLKYYLAGFGSLALVFFAAARPVVMLMTAPPFHGAYTVVGVVAIAYMLKGCYLILLPGVYFEKKLHLQATIEWLAAVLNIGLNLALIPALGMEGAAYATCLSYASLPVAAYFVSRRYLVVQYEWRQLLALVAGLTVSGFVLSWISTVTSSAAQLGLSVLSLILFGVFVVAAVLGKSERQMGLRLLAATRRSGA